MIIVPKKKGPLLYFKALDCAGIKHVGYVVLGWRIMDHPGRWTRRFNDFKFGEAQALRGAIKVMPRAISKVDFYEDEPTALVCAIGHNDTTLDLRSALAKIGAPIAATKGWDWRPDALTKKKHRSLKRLGSGGDRDSEVENTYIVDPDRLHGYKTVIILDDFYTRGATTQDIARAVRDAVGDVRIVCIGLAKNENRAWAERWGEKIDNSHIPGEWAGAWDTA